MNWRGLVGQMIEGVRGLRAAAVAPRVVLDLTSPRPGLVRFDGGCSAREIGEDMENALRNLEGELAPGTVVDCIFSARLVSLRRWSAPDVPASKLSRIVDARVAAEMPVAAESLFWSAELAGNAQERFVLVHLIRRRFVEKLCGDLEKAKLVPGFFEDESGLLADMARQRAATGEVLVLRRSQGVGLLLEADQYGPRQIYTVSASGEADGWLAELAQRWTEGRAQRPAAARLFLAPEVADIGESASRSFGLRAEALAEGGPKGLWPAFPAACGLLAAPRPRRRGGLNPFYDRAKPLNKALGAVESRMRLVAPIAVLLIFFAGIFDYAMVRVAQRGVDSALGRARLASARIDAMQQKTEMLEVMSRSRVGVAELISGVASVMPSGMRLTEFNLSGLTLRLRGEGNPMMLEGFLAALKTNRCILSAELVSIRGGSFEIRCQVLPQDGAKAQAEKPAEPGKEKGK